LEGITYWALDDADPPRILKEHAKGNASQHDALQGLGEMTADELKSTTLGPEAAAWRCA